jgi:hypothetical protein
MMMALIPPPGEKIVSTSPPTAWDSWRAHKRKRRKKNTPFFILYP